MCLTSLRVLVIHMRHLIIAFFVAMIIALSGRTIRFRALLTNVPGDCAILANFLLNLEQTENSRCHLIKRAKTRKS